MTRIISLLFLLLFSWRAMGQTEPKVEFLYQDKSSIYRAIEDTTKVSQSLNGDERELVEFGRRQLILGFLEDFKTAYSREDYELLDLFLSKSSLVIDGKMISQNSLSESNSLDQSKSNPAQHAQQGYLNALKSLLGKK